MIIFLFRHSCGRHQVRMIFRIYCHLWEEPRRARKICGPRSLRLFRMRASLGSTRSNNKLNFHYFIIVFLHMFIIIIINIVTQSRACILSGLTGEQKNYKKKTILSGCANFLYIGRAVEFFISKVFFPEK